MASTAETGHAVNVANFLTLGAYVNGFGPKYNPSKAVLEHSNLLLIHEAAKQAVKNVVDIKTSSKTVINTRADEFADVSQYATQLVNALESSDATERTIVQSGCLILQSRRHISYSQCIILRSQNLIL